jgi:hypothetical protein
MRHDFAVEPVSQSAAHYTHITLLQDSLTLDTNNGESSTAAASRCQSDELPECAENVGDYADNLIPHRMPIQIFLQKKDTKEKEAMLPNKADHYEREADDSFDDTAHQSAMIIADEFMRTHPPPPYGDLVISGNLPCPVIIPQRRPRDWTRGFMRAYAPVLANCGISEATFLDFLKAFHAVNRHLPWLMVVNSAAWCLVPYPISFITGM